jgi:CO/xanthine dehydrogenase Mo-binding subunit
MSTQKQDQRVDAADKIRGDALYIKDEKIPGLWYGATVRCPHPRAKILNILFNQSFDWHRIAIVTAKDIPNNYVAMLEKDMPFLAEDVANYFGEPIVLLAAEDKKDIEKAKQNIKIDYKILPAVFDMQESETSNVKIFHDNNLFKEILIRQGSLSRAKREADHVVEIETNTGFQEHLYLEPQGMVAIPDGNRITIRGSLQCPYYVKNALVNMFAGKKHITIIQSPTGGAFGGKEDYPSLLAGHVALLAAKTGHPVGIFYDREEDVQFTTKRHPSYHRDVAYVKNNGQIVGVDLQIYLDGGAYCTLSQVVLARSALTGLGSYHIPNVRIKAKALATNTVPSGAFRGFGGPQAVFAIEMLIEKIAVTLEHPPDKIRRLNLIKKGQKTATGQVLKYSVSALETFNDVIRCSDYHRKYQLFKKQNNPIIKRLQKRLYPRSDPGDILKGIGISAFLHGAGFTGTGENKIQGKIRVKLHPDGKVLIYTAATEMGQGEQTAMKNIMAQALGINRQQILLAEVNTDLVPDSGPTVASRTTMIIGSLLIEAAKEITRQLCQKLKSQHKKSFRYDKGYFHSGKQFFSFAEVAKIFSGMQVEKQYHHPPIIQFDDIHWKGDAYPVFSWAAAVAEIEVDPVTFETRVVRYTTSHEIGKAINHDQAVAQIQGGSLQGIGYALYEKVALKDGHFDISGFTDYIIPTPTETPEFDVNILENPYPYGPFGAKGLGELPFVGAAPAVVSALWMIFEKEFNQIPLLPEDLAAIFYDNR